MARRLGGRLPAFSIAPVEGTEIIEVYAEGSSPKLVGDAPNVLLDYYIHEVADNDLAQVTEARKFAERNGGEARTKMEKLEKDLANFKNQYKVVELTKGQELQLADVTAAESQLQSNQPSVCMAGDAAGGAAGLGLRAGAAPRSGGR